MATPKYITKISQVIAGDDRIPTDNLLAVYKVTRQQGFTKRQHTPYGDASNGWNTNTVTTDREPQTKYFIEFKYQGTEDKRVWEVLNASDQDTVLGKLDTELGIDIS